MTITLDAAEFRGYVIYKITQEADCTPEVAKLALTRAKDFVRRARLNEQYRPEGERAVVPVSFEASREACRVLEAIIPLDAKARQGSAHWAIEQLLLTQAGETELRRTEIQRGKHHPIAFTILTSGQFAA